MNAIFAFLVISAVELGFTIGQKSPNEVCTVISNCPSALEIIRSGEDTSFLEKKKCGKEGRYTKIWCQVPCVTPDYANGFCKSLNDCNSFQSLLQKSDTSNPNTKRYLQRFKCETSSDPLNVHVCCTDGGSGDDGNGGSSSNGSEEQCGIQTELFKVVGGTVAQLGEYPWLALLQYNHRGQKEFKCGGTLINRRFVLTAAHCTDGYGGKLINVVLGEHNVNTYRDCIQQHCSVAQVIPVEKTLQHPGWVNANSRFPHDLALVKLANDAQYSEFIRPICLPPSNYLKTLNDKFTVAGWGQTENSSSSDVKRYASILLQDNDLCLNTIRIPLVDGQICLGGGSADSCKGDSGGPLMKSEISNGQEVWSIIGVVSFGYNAPCGSLGRPGIYTYVPEYVEWIKKNSRY